jgi:flagellar hook-associated protein 3 FlgL
MSNTILLNINRNMRRVDFLWRQQSTGRQIQFPSEDPILAGRSLRFRTSLAETEQFQKNVAQGVSWMEVTQGAYLNMIKAFETVMQRVNTGASDPSGTWEDRQKMVAEIQGIIEQLSIEMNISYAGRYVFSGFRTDEPPMFTQDNNKIFEINQNFKASDMEKTMSLQKTFTAATLTNADMPAAPDFIINPATGNAADIIERGIGDADAYNPAPGTINFIRETGEYIVAYDLLDATPPATANVMTDLGVPIQISPILMDTAEPIVNNINVIRLPYKQAEELSLTLNGVTITPTEKSLTNPTAYLPEADEVIHIKETGELILGANVAQALASLSTGESMGITYIKNGFSKLEPNPVVYFDCTELTQPGGAGTPWIPGKSYTMDNQSLEFEFGISTRIQVNSLAKDTFTANMYAQLHSFCEFVMGAGLSDPAKLREKFEAITPPLSASEIDKLVTEQIDRENKLIETTLRDRFSNMIKITQDYSSSVSFQETSLGVRMNRLDMIGKRLEQDYETYSELLSDNEDVNLIEVIMKLAAAESILTAAYKTGANIMQLSLINFI